MKSRPPEEDTPDQSLRRGESKEVGKEIETDLLGKSRKSEVERPVQ